MRKADVAIIGTGPAGAMAACHLADTGIEVVILEQFDLPRAKACGGLVPESAFRHLPEGLQPPVQNRVSRIHFLYRHADLHVVDRPDSSLAGVKRAEFDNALIHYALERGRGSLTLKENYRVAEITEYDNRVLIRGTNQEVVQADYLIAADGATSKTARCLGLNPHKLMAAGIDVEARVTPACYHSHANHVLFDYYCLPQGYGWIFPKSDGLLSLGVATWGNGIDLKPALGKFLSHWFPGNQILDCQHHAHPIPVYSGRRRIASRRTCLAGDAASLVDPVTGEGIRFALQSGRMAAEVIRDILHGAVHGDNEAPDFRRYQERMNSLVENTLEPLARFSYLPFMQAPEYYYRTFVVGTAH